MFLPSLINLYLINKGLGDPTGLSGRFKTAKDSLFRRLGYQPITTPASGTNTSPAPAINPVPSTPASGTNTSPAPAINPVPSTPAPIPSAAPASPSLPSGALTAEGGGAISFQAPSVNIPEFNTTPKPAPAPAPQATQNPFYTTAPAPVTTPAPSQAPSADPSISLSQFTQRYIDSIKRKYRSHNPHIITTNPPGANQWKPRQFMNTNSNASNANYYKAKSPNTTDKVINPVTAQSK